MTKIMKVSPVLFLLYLFLASSVADAFQAEVLPRKIRQGDPFVIRVRGAGASAAPVAFLEDREIPFSSCGKGCFIAVGAMHIDARPGVYPIRLRAGARKKNLKISVGRASFPEMSLTLPEDKVTLSPEDLERVERENEKVTAVVGTISERQWEGKFKIPLEHDISTVFGAKRILNQKNTSVHRGVDIRGSEGEEVKAANRGRIVLTDELFFGGNTVIVDHGQGIYTIYMHLSGFNNNPGDIVSQGDVIGFVGSTGRSSGPHLHFGVKVLNINTNPVSFLGLKL